MKAILATVMLRDEDNNQLARFTETVTVEGEGYMAAGREGIAIAAAHAVEEFARHLNKLIDAEMKEVDAVEAKLAAAKALSDEIAPRFAAYEEERQAVERKHGGVRTKIAEIRKTLGEVQEIERKRLVKA